MRLTQYWRGPLEEACSEYNRTVNRFSDNFEGSKPFLTEAAIEEMENVAKSKNRLNATGFLRRTLRGELFVIRSENHDASCNGSIRSIKRSD